MSRPRTSFASDAVRKAASDWVARCDAGLSETEEAELRTWLGADRRHEEAFARYEKLWAHLGRPRAVGAATQLSRDLVLLRRRDRRRRVRWAGAASLLVVMLGISWWASLPGTVKPSAAGAPSVVLIVPEHRVLADGTVVEYPAGSMISVDFSSPKLRQVTLVRGEAHFLVAKDSARPFVVRAAGVDVQAVGTAFSVQLAKSVVEIVVTEGRVAVDKSISRNAPPMQRVEDVPPTSTMLDAGHKLSVALDPGDNALSPQVETLSAMEIAQRLVWRNPRMEFSDTPLHEVVAAINRYAAERRGVQFTIQDPAVGAKRLSGMFRVDDASAFVGILEKGFGIRTERLGEQEIVLRRGR